MYAVGLAGAQARVKGCRRQESSLCAHNWLSQIHPLHSSRDEWQSQSTVPLSTLLNLPRQWILIRSSQPGLPFFLVSMQHLNQQIPPLIFQRRGPRLHPHSLEIVTHRAQPEERLNPIRLVQLVEMMMVLPYYLLWMQKTTAYMRVIRTIGTSHTVLKVKEVTFGTPTTTLMQFRIHLIHSNRSQRFPQSKQARQETLSWFSDSDSLYALCSERTVRGLEVLEPRVCPVRAPIDYTPHVNWSQRGLQRHC
jgi:hypothetical protein